ncbi:hypothetical protein N7G274_001555 [Stereocaulon virgatum]|uniref:Uncharacterized protein n=1 Tax=Stereocaulon virgatum TaxID=373712 RepID=A0ABR4AK02_9LECA
MADTETINSLISYNLKGIDVSAVENAGKSAKDNLDEQEEDSENPDFKSGFQQLLENIKSSQNKNLEISANAPLTESFTLASQIAALEITKDRTFMRLTPLSTSGDDEHYQNSLLDENLGHDPPVFYDALEEIDHGLPFLFV